MNEVVLYTPTMAIEVRRALTQVPSVMACLNDTDKAVFYASTERPISAFNDVELAAELAKVIKWVLIDVGCRADEEDMQYIVIRLTTLLRRYYCNLSMKDFRLAFEMAALGELDAYLPKDRNGLPDRGHYQMFNAEYVGKILTAYKARRGEVLIKAEKARPRKEVVRVVDMQGAKDRCREVFEEYKAGGVLNCSLVECIIFTNLLAGAGLAERVEMDGAEQAATIEAVLTRKGRRTTGREKARRERLRAAFDNLISNNIELTL